ncbi:MAG: hypothetical protein AB1403_17250 [Candidatus Riflebacteria bacterium]
MRRFYVVNVALVCNKAGAGSFKVGFVFGACLQAGYKTVESYAAFSYKTDAATTEFWYSGQNACT